MRLKQSVVLVAVCFFLAALLPLAAQDPEIFVYHAVRLDGKGGILPWYGNGPSEAYDHDIRLLWDFWHNMRNCSNGVPYYLQHQVWQAGEDDPRGLGGDQITMALSSWNLLHGYLGDPEVKKNMIRMADYWLAHGLSSPDALWPNLPYPYKMEVHGDRYDGDMRAGKGYLQPDKAGSFGAELVVLYKITNDQKYLLAATNIANTLSRNIRKGDADNSPWPFRVNAMTGAVHKDIRNGKTFEASYTTAWTPTLRLFQDLIELKQGELAGYRKAIQITTDWLKTYPLKTNKWGPFFEDIPTADYSDTELNADTLAFYILQHPDWDKDWRLQARGILDWTFNTLGNHEFGKWNVVPINEQTVFRVPGNSHTSRHESVELLFCEKTGDCSRKEEAIRGLNWATYTVNSDGTNRYPHDDIWLSDGYGDYVRHYLRSMASAPELAPENQNHLLRTTSVIQTIVYAQDKIDYTKFDSDSTEVFKLGIGIPKSVDGGAMNWNAGKRTLVVTAKEKKVTVLIDKN